MANEIRLAATSGNTYVAQVRQFDNTQIGSDVTLTENASTGQFYGTFPSGSATDNTWYDIIYRNGSINVGAVTLFWNGSELLPSDPRDVWETSSRTLTSTANTVTVASGSDIEIIRGVTFSATLTGLTISASWEAVYITIKGDADEDSDTAAIVQLLESNPADGNDGLIRLNGGTTTASWGSITVDQGAGSVAWTLSDDATAVLELNPHLYYDVKILVDDGTSTIANAKSNASVVSTPTNTIG